MKYNLNTSTQTLEVTVPGDILSTNVDALRADIFAVLAAPSVSVGKWGTLRLDLSNAQMVDSMGLNLIVSLVRTLQSRGARMQARVSSPNIQRTFIFTRLDKQIDVLPV